MRCSPLFRRIRRPSSPTCRFRNAGPTDIAILSARGRTTVGPSESHEVLEGDAILLLPSAPESRILVNSLARVQSSSEDIVVVEDEGPGEEFHPPAKRPASPRDGSADAAAPSPAKRAATGDEAGPSGQSLPLVLILVGPPGCGKSTFAADLISRAPGRFVRVNQDTISSKGTPGTRKQAGFHRVVLRRE